MDVYIILTIHCLLRFNHSLGQINFTQNIYRRGRGRLTLPLTRCCFNLARTSEPYYWSSSCDDSFLGIFTCGFLSFFFSFARLSTKP